MSRLGITFEEVVQAANELVAKGETPTIDKIRFFLGGTGSNTTISKYLSAWRHGIPFLQSDKIFRNDAPDAVQEAVNRVWQQMREKVEADIEAIKNDSQAKVDAADSRAKAAEKALADLKQEHADLLNLQQRQYAEKELLSLDFKSLREEHTLLSERYKALDERYTDIQGLTSQHLRDLADAHKSELKRLDETVKLREIAYEKLISEIKSQHEDERHQQMRVLDMIKTENKKLEEKLFYLQSVLNKKEIEISELKVMTETVKQESNKTFKLFEVNIEKEKLLATRFINLEELSLKFNEWPKFDTFINVIKSDLDKVMHKYVTYFEEPIKHKKKQIVSSNNE